MDIDFSKLNLNEKERQAMIESLDLCEGEDLESILNIPPKFCSVCSCKINPIRLFFCEGTGVCTEHAHSGHGQPPPVKAMMIYDDKTAATICFMSEKNWSETKRLTDRKGQMSILRKVSPSKA